MGIKEILLKDMQSTPFGQKRTIETLTEESRADFDFFLFLIFATAITTIGLLRDNGLVLVAGMLIAPLLFPIMSLGMGIATVSFAAIVRATATVIESVGVIILVSALTAWLIGPTVTSSITIASTPDPLLYAVAFLAGIITAFSWIKQNMSASLPSVAMTVALVVPLSAVGISIIRVEPDIFFGGLELFFGNFVAITASTLIVFVLFGFSKLRKFQDKVIEAEQK